MTTPDNNHTDGKMVSFDFASGRLFVGHTAASARLCDENGHVQVHGNHGAVLRPLTVLEREQALRNALASPQADKARFLAEEIFIRALVAEDTRDAVTAADLGIARAIALHLAGADINAPALTQAMAAVGSRLGWSAADIWASPAAQFDQIASSLMPQQASSWNQLIMLSSQENEAESEVDVIVKKMAADLLQRAQSENGQQDLGAGIAAAAADSSPDAVGLRTKQHTPVNATPPGGQVTDRARNNQPEQHQPISSGRFIPVEPTPQARAPGVSSPVGKPAPESGNIPAKQCAGHAPAGPVSEPLDTGHQDQRLMITKLGEGESFSSASDPCHEAGPQDPGRAGLPQSNASVPDAASNERSQSVVRKIPAPTGRSQVAESASPQSQDNVYPFSANTDKSRLAGLRSLASPAPAFPGDPAAAPRTNKSATQGLPATMQNLDNFFQTEQESMANELAELLNREADLRGLD